MLRNPEESLGRLIDKQTVAYIASVDADGFPNMKAMLAPRKREGLRVFHFTTNASSMRVSHFRANPKGSIYFCDRRFYRGVMLLGYFQVLEDAANKEAIWLDGDERYYPLGVTDPDYCVLKFMAHEGRYYADFHSESFPVKAF